MILPVLMSKRMESLALDQRVGVTDGVGRPDGEVGTFCRTGLDLGDLAQLVLGLLGR